MLACITFPPLTRHAIESALSERFGEVVTITHSENIWPSSVFRCTLHSSRSGIPGTVIVRLPREGNDPRSGSAPLELERAALEYLAGVGSALAPRFLAGGGTSAGFLVTEDIGTSPSLLDLLLGKDTEIATQGALAFARGLGALHRQTMQPSNPDTLLLSIADLAIAEHWQQVQTAVVLLGLPAPQGLDQEIAEVDRLLSEPGEYLALSSGDPSVVNCKITDTGVRFFDFEGACFRHALIDAAVLRFLYPTGAPAWRLPSEVASSLEIAYRTELAQTCPAILEDRSYEKGMAAACAAWMIIRMARLSRVDSGPDRDTWPLLPAGWSGPIPVRSRRRQLVSILETSIASLYQAGTFNKIAAWAERVTQVLHTRWPEAAEILPLYPAFE